MRKISLYIAISLDAKIAKSNGDVSWLDDIPNPEKSDFGYYEFYNSLDITLMGRKTYNFLQNYEGEFPYKETKNYVFTKNRDYKSTKDVTIIHDDPIEFAKKLKAEEGKDIWLIGGGQLNTCFLNADMIDEFIIHIMPVILGQGISLFESVPIEKKLTLIKSEVHSNAAILMHYKK